MKRKEVRGLSPVIATVLLIVIVIAIALIVFVWIKGMIGESVTKFDGKSIALVCEDVSFEADYSEGTLYISNPGVVPIFGMNVKVVGDGSYVTEDLRDYASDYWPENGLNSGATFFAPLAFTGNEIVLIPVLIGESNSGKKTYVCNEKQYGYTILI